MNAFRRICIGLLLISLTGCASTQFRVASEPPGATVSLWERQEHRWVPQGTTPCKFRVHSASGAPRTALVSLTTNQNQILTLRPRGLGTTAATVAGCSSGSLFILMAGAQAGSSLALVAGLVSGVWVIGGAALILDNAYNRNLDLRVDFHALEQQRRPEQPVTVHPDTPSFAKAIHSGNAEKLQRGDRNKFEIITNSPTLMLDGTNTQYKLFEIQDLPHLPLDITILSFGLRLNASLKRVGRCAILKPRLFMLDPAGQVLGEIPAPNELKTSYYTYWYETAWQSKLPSSGRCYILVMPDRRVLNKQMGSFRKATYWSMYPDLSIPVWAHDIGFMEIRLQ